MKPVLHSLSYSIDFLSEQVAGFSPAAMVEQPDGITNHAAWTLGHLAHVLTLIGGVIGIPSSLPGGWTRRYGPGSRPVGDPEVYESGESLLGIIREIAAKIETRIGEMRDEELDEPFPDEDYRSVFPTIRHALTQVLVGHTAFHVGQLSVWRKAMGPEPMKRSYE